MSIEKIIEVFKQYYRTATDIEVKIDPPGSNIPGRFVVINYSTHPGLRCSIQYRYLENLGYWSVSPMRLETFPAIRLVPWAAPVESVMPIMNAIKDYYANKKPPILVSVEPFKVGDFVHYHDGFTTTNGRIKWIDDKPKAKDRDGKEYTELRIVVACNDDWNSYQDYTGQLTDTRYVFHGWVDTNLQHIPIPTPDK